jgi:hypothetical protein
MLLYECNQYVKFAINKWSARCFIMVSPQRFINTIQYKATLCFYVRVPPYNVFKHLKALHLSE